MTSLIFSAAKGFDLTCHVTRHVAAPSLRIHSQVVVSVGRHFQFEFRRYLGSKVQFYVHKCKWWIQLSSQLIICIEFKLFYIS